MHLQTKMSYYRNCRTERSLPGTIILCCPGDFRVVGGEDKRWSHSDGQGGRWNVWSGWEGIGGIEDNGIRGQIFSNA